MTAPVTWTRSADRRVWVAEAPGGVLLTVTQAGRDSWAPAVVGPDGKTRWRGRPCPTRLAAQASAEGEAAP